MIVLPTQKATHATLLRHYPSDRTVATENA